MKACPLEFGRKIGRVNVLFQMDWICLFGVAWHSTTDYDIASFYCGPCILKLYTYRR